MLKIKTVTFELDGKAVTLTLSEATGRMSVRRSFLALQGVEVNKADLEKGDIPIDLMFLRSTMYPDMISVVVNADGMPLPKTPDEFAALMDQLPEAAITKWNTCVYELNPHWREAEKTEEAQKNESSAATISTGG